MPGLVDKEYCRRCTVHFTARRQFFCPTQKIFLKNRPPNFGSPTPSHHMCGHARDAHGIDARGRLRPVASEDGRKRAARRHLVACRLQTGGACRLVARATALNTNCDASTWRCSYMPRRLLRAEAVAIDASIGFTTSPRTAPRRPFGSAWTLRSAWAATRRHPHSCAEAFSNRQPCPSAHRLVFRCHDVCVAGPSPDRSPFQRRRPSPCPSAVRLAFSMS